MRYASVCDGISAVSVAWQPLGWTCSWVSEIDPFACAVIAHRFPEHRNLGDMLAITKESLADEQEIDLLVGGTPCQSFSVAGLRKGMDDPRGNLSLRFVQLADVLRPRWILWENVPGVLSSGSGRDFGAILGALAELGYGWAYRILDAQYFGVPQRRRRVFVVGYRGDWRRAAAVLFDSHCLGGHPAPGPKAEEVDSSHAAGRDGTVSAKWAKGSGGPAGDECQNLIAGTLCASDADRRGSGTNPGVLIPFDPTQITSPENRSRPGDGDPCHPLTASGRAPHIFQCQGTSVGPVGTLRTGSNVTNGVPFLPIFAIQERAVSLNESAGPQGAGFSAEGSAYTLEARHHVQSIAAPEIGVRRLTPRECERLQGFPDDWTLVPYRGKPASDSPRYKAIGNSMAEPVMRWIGTRIQMVETLLQQMRWNRGKVV